MAKTPIITLTTLVIFTFSAQAQNLIRNASFESPAIPTDTFQRIAPDAWTPGITPGFLINGDSGRPTIAPRPQHGQQYADVGNEPPFTLAQEFTITNGGFFALQWFDSAGHDAGLTTSPYSVLVLTGALEVVTSNRFDAYHAEFGAWVARSNELAFRSGTYTLRFQAEGVLNGLDSLIDNVSLVRLPDDDMLANIHCSAVDICWAGRTSQLYQVQYRTNVSDTNWFDFGSPVLGTGTNCVTDGISGIEHRFYRVIRVP